MADFEYSLPVKVYFGTGRVWDIGGIAERNGYRRGLLISDAVFVNSGLAGRLADGTPSVAGLFSEFSPNPTLKEAAAACAAIKELNADFVVALGGGSALDLAKFACSAVYAEYDLKEYFYQRKQFGSQCLPLIAVPSTAGTGSEVTSVSVCTDDETGWKAPLSHENFMPKLAVVDPELTLSVPPHITAATGMDALSHALEAFWSRRHQPICDMFATAACKLIFGSLESAYKDGGSLEPRESMSLAALYAGLAFSVTKTAGCHACSYPLSADYSIPHGEACALTLDGFIRLNASAENGRLHGAAKELGFEDAFAMADRVYSMKKNMGMKLKLTEFGIIDINPLAEKSLAHPLMANNPVRPNLEQMRAFFEGLR